MESFDNLETLSSQETSKSNPKNSLSTDLKKDNKNEKIIGGAVWYSVLLIYAILLTVTGGVTFFYNNGFASREENIKKLDLMNTTEQLTMYKKLLEIEVKNIENVNNIANQSFNVVLGSLLGFLSGSLTALSNKDNEVLENKASARESQPDNLKD